MANESLYCNAAYTPPPSKHMYLGCGLSTIEKSEGSISNLSSLHLDNVNLCSESDLDELFGLSSSAGLHQNYDRELK